MTTTKFSDLSEATLAVNELNSEARFLSIEASNFEAKAREFYTKAYEKQFKAYRVVLDNTGKFDFEMLSRCISLAFKGGLYESSSRLIDFILKQENVPQYILEEVLKIEAKLP